MPVGAIGQIPILGPVAQLFYSMTPKCSQLKDLLRQMEGGISKEGRALLDDGKAPGYPEGDAGIAAKLQAMGFSQEQIGELAGKLGIPPQDIGLMGLQPLELEENEEPPLQYLRKPQAAAA